MKEEGEGREGRNEGKGELVTQERIDFIPSLVPGLSPL